MKILWLSHLIPYPPKGGVLQRSFNMIREVGKYHNITLVAFNQDGFLKSSLPDSEDPIEVAKKELLQFVDSIHVCEIPENLIPGGRYVVALKALLSAQAYNMVWLQSKSSYKLIKDLVSETSFDAVHLDTISLCIFSDIFKDLPLVLNHHNFESQMLRSRAISEHHWIKSLYYRLESYRLLNSEIEYCQKVNLNLTCSDDDSKSMEKIIGIDNFISVPNGVDVSYFYPNPSVKILDGSIVIVGGLSWYPNREAVEYFIRDIWPLIRTQIPGTTVDIIGRGPTSEMLKLAEVDERVFVHGFVDDVREYLWRSQFYVCPIRTGGGTKLKILDALATGSCIIADPFSCKGIRVRDGENVLYAKNPQDYVDQIRYLIDHPEQQTRLRKAGPELIRRLYSYDRIGKGYSQAISGLIK
ncbi:glycosyltransferase [Marinobacter sp. NP-4(2019)]|uniref:glycosyltransferase family 4 protein n=1 Tax=Marinobacter sp. NP-4(2019) TaxID=2488665 RepID=UPI000FC3EE86|nr:glycosyltransferase family 4 protein [Marinobacter sp. NP-4(2019)]AZT84116.1 glycosyltransferase [Marinobacter sp. NP-4(2019)]